MFSNAYFIYVVEYIPRVFSNAYFIYVVEYIPRVFSNAYFIFYLPYKLFQKLRSLKLYTPLQELSVYF